MKHVLLLLALVFTSLSFSQDTGIISGKILDAEMFSEPLLMASISLVDTDFSTQTNFNGNFEIFNVLPGNYILSIAFAGYDELSIPVEIKSNERLEILKELHAKKLPIHVNSGQSTKIALNQ